MVYVKWIILIVILLFFITFGVKNSGPVYLNYYFNLQYIELPLYGLVYIAILLGIFIGMIVGIFDRFSLRKKVKRLEKEKKELHENLTAKERELERAKESENQRESH
ncbi:MAG: LapA family protein, partial [Deltaproteobacteria bacterium]